MKLAEEKNTGLKEQELWKLLEEVTDPEVPVLSIIDLGIVRAIRYSPATGAVAVTVTPTYSGCPALDAISTNIRLKLLEHGYRDTTIKQSLSPAWTTDWMTEEGKQKLKAFGIAPPHPRPQVCSLELFAAEAVQCPRCNSYHTEMISRFSSTACKALHRCLDCQEAFDYFKCH